MAEGKAVQLSQHEKFDPRKYVSQLLHDSPQSRVVLFCLEPGQELPRHDSPSEVLFYGVRGRTNVLVGSEEIELSPQSLAVCPPHVGHGIGPAVERTVVLAVITPRP